MLQYTKATLKAHLKSWVEGNGTDADEDFVAALDEIIQTAENNLSRDIDLDNLDSSLDTTTSNTEPEVFKPGNLTVERLLQISVAGHTYALLKRSRAFIEAMNSDGVNAAPKYYAEFDEDRWFVAPIANGSYLITVHGNYRPASITDGDDGTTTWFSTHVADVLALACRSAAAEFIKLWSLKAACDAEYTSRLADARALTANLQRIDIEDLIGSGRHQQQPTVPPEPAATN